MVLFSHLFYVRMAILIFLGKRIYTFKYKYAKREVLYSRKGKLCMFIFSFQFSLFKFLKILGVHFSQFKFILSCIFQSKLCYFLNFRIHFWINLFNYLYILIYWSRLDLKYSGRWNIFFWHPFHLKKQRIISCENLMNSVFSVYNVY